MGKKVAAKIKEELTRRSDEFLQKTGRRPRLAVVVHELDDAGRLYLSSKLKRAKSVGVEVEVFQSGDFREDVERAVEWGDGVMIEEPFPEDYRGFRVREFIPPEKDVDGCSLSSLGRLVAGVTPFFPPATAEAVVEILRFYGFNFRGRRALVVGRSLVVGKPLAHLLLNEDATVTVAHSKTTDLPSLIKEHDLVVAAVGVPELLKAEWFAPRQWVVDVGINYVDNRVVGDVEAGAEEVVEAITPVPGGVGPVTTLLVFKHVIDGAEASI